MTSRPGFYIDWILWELVAVADAESIPVFDRFATKLDDGTACRQEIVGAFLVGVRGYARLSNQPPAIPEDAKDDRRAWAIVGTILFWWMKGSDQDGPADEINKAWKLLQQQYSPCFADILYNINHSQWQRRENFIDLATLFPDHVRPLLEDAVRCRQSLTSLFQYGGSADAGVFTDCHLDLGKGRHWDLNRSFEQLGRRSEGRQGRRPRHSGDTEPTLVKVETRAFSSEL